MPLFSVIIPAYNAARTVGRAVASALAQTQPATEVVVCDDGSKDALHDALAPYRERLLVVKQENRGLSAARNAAIAASSGDWIVLLDADDEWLPERLERISAFINQNPWADIVTTDAIVRTPGQPDQRYYELMTFCSDVDEQPFAILRGSFIWSGAAVRRASLQRSGGFDDEARYPGEYEAWVRLILAGSRAGLVPEPLAIYHRSPTSLSQTGSYNMLAKHDVLAGCAERDDLEPALVQAAVDSLAELRPLVRVAQARRALDGQDVHRRRSAIRVALDGEQPVRTRAGFALAALLGRDCRARS